MVGRACKDMEAPEDILLPLWLQTRQPEFFHAWLSKNTPTKTSLSTPLCYLIQKFRPEVGLNDRHRYHLVKTAAGTVALHRHDPLIGCVRTAIFRSTQETGPVCLEGAHVKQHPLPEAQPSMLQRNVVDIVALRHWLTTCTLNHYNCRLQGSRGLPQSMRVIDCWDYRVISWGPGMRFAALSYTWGTSTAPDVSEGSEGQQSDRLPLSLPRTVDDAITLIRRLGLTDLRYLWVDRYCIRQNRLEEKHEQIQQMHQIYSNADLTIIAAAGEDADSGLPGIGSTPRTPQSFIATNDGALVLLQANMNSITQSPWMKRGWTFQEACFSRRRLFFTSEQVTFECADMTAQEVLRIPLRHGTGCTLKPLFGVHLSNFVGEQSRPLSSYVEEYSRRVLSYDSDALNAFSGVLHALEQCQPRLHHLWAIQINTCACAPRRSRDHAVRCSCRPTMSLAWDMQDDFDMSHRRWEYPSWSWLGWKGSVTFSRLNVGTASNVSIWTERSDGTLRLIDSRAVAEDITRAPSEYSRYIHIESCVFDVEVRTHGDAVFLEQAALDGAVNRAVVRAGNTCVLASQLVDSPLQAILLDRHDVSGGFGNAATLLLVTKNEGAAASSRVGVCEVQWFPFGYSAARSGRVERKRLE